MNEVDVLIVGAGVAGLSASIYLSRSSLSSLIVEKSAPGGKLGTIHKIANYPGVAPVSGASLAYEFLKSAQDLGALIEYGNVISIEKDGDGFITRTDMDTYVSKAVIVATGLSASSSIKGEKERIGYGVSYCATCDGNFFKGKPMAVYGSGDRALEEALYLAPLSSSLYLLSPGRLEGSEPLLRAVRENERIVVIENALIKEIKGEGEVSSFDYSQNDETKSLEVKAIFPLVGEKGASAFLSPLGVKMNGTFIEVDPYTNETNVPNLYAAGDIVDKKLRQVVTAASDGAIAASAAIASLNRSKKHA